MQSGDTVLVINGEYRGYFASFFNTVGSTSNVELLHIIDTKTSDSPGIHEFILVSLPTTDFRATPFSFKCNIKEDSFFEKAKKYLDLEQQIVTLAKQLEGHKYRDEEHLDYYNDIMLDMWDCVFSNTPINETDFTDLPGREFTLCDPVFDAWLTNIMRELCFGYIVTNQVGSEDDAFILTARFMRIIYHHVEYIKGGLELPTKMSDITW